MAGKSFLLNRCGVFRRADLSDTTIYGSYDVMVGGPPCKPWSAVNTSRRGRSHCDYRLLSEYFRHININRPKVFLLENVPLLERDITLQMHLKQLESKDYSIACSKIRYSDYGASTKRHRFFVFGSRIGEAKTFFVKLSKLTSPSRTVRDVIWDLRNKQKNEVFDHVWPDLKTINKYVEKYRTHKFGWYVLEWDEPAPSFGNVMKTYILHPDAFNGGTPRVISVKEAALIMGFEASFRFPLGAGVGIRYQMVVDSVSPKFSFSAAKVISEELQERS